MGPLKSQNRVEITLPAENTLSDLLIVGHDVCFQFMLHAVFAYRFRVVHPCVIAYENPLQHAHLCLSVSCFGTHLAQIL